MSYTTRKSDSRPGFLGGDEAIANRAGLAKADERHKFCCCSGASSCRGGDRTICVRYRKINAEVAAHDPHFLRQACVVDANELILVQPHPDQKLN